MYTTIAIYTVVNGDAEKLKQRIQTDYGPLISQLPGLIGSYLLEGRADQVISLNIFDSKGHADLASGPLGFWMRQVLGDCTVGQPEIVSGQMEGITAPHGTLLSLVGSGTRWKPRVVSKGRFCGQ
jgi:hypothetical protein